MSDSKFVRPVNGLKLNQFVFEVYQAGHLFSSFVVAHDEGKMEIFRALYKRTIACLRALDALKKKGYITKNGNPPWEPIVVFSVGAVIELKKTEKDFDLDKFLERLEESNLRLDVIKNIISAGGEEYGNYLDSVFGGVLNASKN